MAKKKPVDVDQLLLEGFSIIQDQISKLGKGLTDQLLDQKSAQILNEHLRTLLAAKREQRQANMEDDIEKLSDQDLNELAKQAMKLITKEPNNAKKSST